MLNKFFYLASVFVIFNSLLRNLTDGKAFSYINK